MTDLDNKQAEMRNRQRQARKKERSLAMKVSHRINPRRRVKIDVADTRFTRVGEMLRHLLGEGLAAECVRAMVDIIRDPNVRANSKIAAFKSIVETAEGKPVQAIQVSQGLSDADALRLLELNERLEQGNNMALPVERKPN